MNSTFSYALTATFFCAAFTFAESEFQTSPGYPAIQVPKELKLALFADERQVTDPTALCLDSQNRVYVAETHRWRKQVQDIRHGQGQLKERVEGDISCWTTDDRIAYHKKWSGKAFLPWEEYTTDAEKIRRLEDTDGDGKADRSHYYRDDFNDPLSGTAGGIIERDGTVYFANIPGIYALRDLDGDGVAEEVKTLADGFGCRVSFSGHDLNGFAFGPDGKLYWSIGDRGYHVEKEGQIFSRADSGAVFRCYPNGSGFEVVYHRLRNPKEIVFDEFGNLFTVDNDYDNGDRERIVYLVEHGDAGWQMGHQTIASFGNVVYKYAKPKTATLKEREDPWMAEQMWKPRQQGQPAYILPPVALAPNGPCGLAYNPGVTALPARYQSTFFVASYVGSVGKSKVEAFRLKPDGGGFGLASSQPFIKGMAATDLDWGADGKLYISDFIGGWLKTNKGRIWTLSEEEQLQRADLLEVASLLQEGFAKREEEELGELLGHRDQRIRQRAQFELATREPEAAYAVFAPATVQKENLLKRLHAIWGIGQMKLEGGDAESLFLALLLDDEEEVRANAARTLGWVPELVPSFREVLWSLLEDSSPRVASLAALTLANEGAPESTPAALELLAVNQDRDLYVRHGAIMMLTRCASATELGLLTSHHSPFVRLGAVVALRRQKAQEIDRFFDDPIAAVREEAVRGAYDENIETALPQLADRALMIAQSIGAENEFYPLAAKRAIYAAWRVGRPKDMEAVTSIAANSTIDLRVRRDALVALLDWNEPPVADPVVGTAVPLPAGRTRMSKENLGSALLLWQLLPRDSVAAQGELMELALKLSQQVEQRIPSIQLGALAKGERLPREARELAARLMAKEERGSELHKMVLAELLQDGDAALRSYAREAFLSIDRKAALVSLAEALTSEKTTIEEKQLTLRILGNEQSKVSNKALKKTLSLATQGKLPRAIVLDAIMAAESADSPQVREALASFRRSLPVGEPLAEWFAACVEGGNASQGEDVYLNHGAAQCVRCHVMDGVGGKVGPDLSTIGREHDKEYLLRSLLTPSSEVAEGFGMGSVTLKDGSTVSGFVLADDDEGHAKLRVGEEVRTISKEDIASRTEPISSMPPMSALLSKEQARDLVAYLATRVDDQAAEKHK